MSTIIMPDFCQTLRLASDKFKAKLGNSYAYYRSKGFIPKPTTNERELKAMHLLHLKSCKTCQAEVKPHLSKTAVNRLRAAARRG